MAPLDFDPNEPAPDNGNYFGFPFTPAEAEIVLMPVPWGVTASYGDGASLAPEAIIAASTQLDFYDPLYPGGWRRGIATLPVNHSIKDLDTQLRTDARKVIAHLERGGHKGDECLRSRLARVNEASAGINDYIRGEAAGWLAQGKVVGLVGGDHSTPLGLIRALGEKAGTFGILHIDAHADLRDAYEGFTWSHASIMHNVLREAPHVGRIVQVGVRDLCEAEKRVIDTDPRVRCFDDFSLRSARFGGATWQQQCEAIVEALPEKVYVSFDIDGLSPENCPGTGTPVPGGLSFAEAVYLLDSLSCSGHRIVGFDLCEVGPRPDDEWDANVGARVLLALCNATLKSRPI